MKKKYHLQGRKMFFPLKEKIWLIMKLTFLFTIICVFQSMAVISQNKVTNINIKNAPLEQFFSEIEQKTSTKFLYRYENIEGKLVTVNMANASVDELLDAVLPANGLFYTHMKNNLIVVSPSVPANKEKTITGTVVDNQGVPLLGVNVVVKGTYQGTTSDDNGKFSLVVPNDQAILQFSFIGYTMQEITVGDKTSINVVLKEDTRTIDEVVVTALGIEKNKRTLTYTTQQVNTENLATVNKGDVGSALAGKVAGIAVMTGSTGGSRIIIRGERSINNSNTPLIIMDGVPSNFGLGNIDDIESINVLKGPSASALYGSSAADGVIIVTTKKGKYGETKIEVNSQTTFGLPYLYPKFQNVYGQGVGGDYNSNSEYYSWGPKMEGQTVTNWTGDEIDLKPQRDNVKDLFRTAYSLINNFSYSTGTKKSTAYFSYTNTKGQGLLPVNTAVSHKVNMRMDTELIKNLKLDAVLTWQRSKTENKPTAGDDLFSPMWQLVKMPRSIRTQDIKDAYYYDSTGSKKQLTWAPGSTGNINPYWSMKGREAEEISNNVNAQASLRYNIKEWLYIQARGRMAFNNGNEEYKEYWDTQYVASGKGSYELKYTKSQALNADILLGFDKDLTKDWHLSANAGAEIRDNQSAKIDSDTGSSGLVLENKFYLGNGATVSTENSASHDQTQSVYGTAQVGFRNYLFLDVTARNDWSSTLPSPYDYFYPSVGLTGIISDIIKLPEAISFAKLRGSYAEVGAGAGFAQIFQTYSRTLSGTQGSVSTGSTKVASQLIPEKTKSWEAGTEIRVLKDRIGIDFTWYKSNTYNQLVKVTSPPTSGFSEAYINCGNVQNKGIEFMLNAVPVKTSLLKWDVNVNFSRNWSKIIKLTDTMDEYEIDAPNLSVGDNWIIVGRPYGEILSRGFERNDAGRIIVDALGMPRITTDSKTDLGNYNYDFRSGLTSNIQYKNWNLYFLIDLNYGGVRQSATEAQMMLCGTSKATLYGRDGFVLDGVKEVTNTDGSVSYVENDIQIDAETYGKAIGGRASNGCGEAFNHKATNSRLRELSIGYKIPVRNTVIKDLTVSAIGRNLFYIYNACKWFDPDTSYDLDKNGQGSESAFLPGTRSLGINIKLTL